LVGVVFLLFATIQFGFFFLSYSTVAFAPVAALKGFLCIAMCLALLKLSEGWRLFTIFVTGLTVLGLSLYFLSMIFLSEMPDGVVSMGIVAICCCLRARY